MIGAPQRRKVRRVNRSEYNRPSPSPVSSRDSRIRSNAINNNGSASIGSPLDHLSPNLDRRVGMGNGQHPSTHLDDTVQRVPQTQSSPQAALFSPEAKSTSPKGPTLSNLLHLSHDPVPSSEPQSSPSDTGVGQWRGIDAVCADLEISTDGYLFLSVLKSLRF